MRAVNRTHQCDDARTREERCSLFTDDVYHLYHLYQYHARIGPHKGASEHCPPRPLLIGFALYAHSFARLARISLLLLRCWCWCWCRDAPYNTSREDESREKRERARERERAPKQGRLDYTGMWDTCAKRPFLANFSIYLAPFLFIYLFIFIFIFILSFSHFFTPPPPPSRLSSASRAYRMMFCPQCL